MKRSDKQIGRKIILTVEEKVTRKKIQGVISVLLIISLTACEKAWHGQDGHPGNAFLSLDWQIEEPLYIDAGTGAIPPVFYWGQYYDIYPGQYELYYDGQVWTGMGWATYAWEVDYTIWELPGEKGDWYYNGANGPDNYFTIECNPYGPYIESSYKSSREEDPYEWIEATDESITVSQKLEPYELIITYKKVNSRSHNN